MPGEGWKSLLTLLTIGTVLSCSKPAPANSQRKPVSAVEQKPQTDDFTPYNPDDALVKPEIVRSEEVRIEKGVKMLTVGNDQGHYFLSCNSNLDSCITPTPGKEYLLFTKSTRWRFPGGKEAVTLAWFQDWTVTYTNEENIALVPEGGGVPGMYWLRRWNKNKDN